MTGDCSSITLASPLLIEIDSWARKREQQKLALRRQWAATGHPVPVVAEEDDDPVERAMMKGAGRTKRSGRRR